MVRRAFRVAARTAHLALVLGWTACRILALAVARRRRELPDDRFSFLAGTRFADACEAAGGGFLKVGQLLSSRPDILNDQMCRGLARLQMQVRGVPLDRIVDTRAAAWLRWPCEVDVRPIASGSIAQVHKARLRDGTDAAIKLRRPDVVDVFREDLTLLEWIGRLGAMFPACADLPVLAVLDTLRSAVTSQLDLACEARLTMEFASNFKANSAIRIPRVLTRAGEQDRLVTEYIPGLSRITDVPDPRLRRHAATVALRALYQMIFTDGLVHCDLHPGNVLCDEHGKVVILDCGLAARLDDDVRFAFARFFFAFTCEDAQGCADVILDNASHVDPDLDREAFVADLAAVLEARAPSSVQTFQVAGFAYDMFDVQRRHHVVSTPEFVWPIMSLLCLEGALKQCAPDLDFASEARPYVFAAIVDGLRRKDVIKRLAAS